MNGVAAQAIRSSGMAYRLVYGVELPRLREIAAGYQPDRRVAQQLWDEDVRECRMLGIMLYPVGEFDADIAELWIDTIRPEQAELAQLLCMDIICRQSYAAEMAFRWIADERPVRQLCGFLTITRLLMQGAQFSPDSEAELRDQAASLQTSDYLPLRRAVANTLARL